MRTYALPIALCTLLLASCTTQGGLDAEEVLNRSSVSNSGLLSARILLTARISSVSATTGTLDASGILEGSMQQGGRQLDVAFHTDGVRTSMGQSLTWNGVGRLMVLSEQESYVFLESLETTPALPLLSLPEYKDAIGSWFRLPAVGDAPATVTPDPRFLRLQSDAVRVTKDRGIDTMDGKRMYHYDVAIDPVRLATFLRESSGEDEEGAQRMMAQLSRYDAAGELWIDETTFLLTKAVWNITEKGKDAPTMTLSMSLSDLGLQVTVIAPDNAQPFPQSPLLPGGATILQEF